jgi:hypothetical protein
LTGEDRGAAGDVGDSGVLRDDGDEVRDVAGKVAEIVSLRGLRGRCCLPPGRRVQKKFGKKGCQASFFSRGRPRRLRGALARGRTGRGARAPQRSEERIGPGPGFVARSDSAFSAASATPTPPLKNGLVRRSFAPPSGRGAQLASTVGACGGAFASDVDRPFSDRALARAPLAPGGLT